MADLYNFDSYGQVLADSNRLQPYIEALQKIVFPGSVFVEIGTGPGIFAQLACRFGAERVYALDPNSVVRVGEEISRHNQYQDKIQFIQNYSTRVSLPEKADIIFADIRGVLPLFRQLIPTVIDARERFLKPDGIFLPQKDTMWLAVVEAPDLYEKFIGIWSDEIYDLDLSHARRIAANLWRRVRAEPSQLVTAPQVMGTVDYKTVSSSNLQSSHRFEVTTARQAHGFIVWFDSILTDGIEISNSPEHPELIYGSAFFPFPQPVNLGPGHSISLDIQAHLIGEDYVWRWNTTIEDGDESKTVLEEFTQSTFHGLPLNIQSLHRMGKTFSPTLNQDGEVLRFILNAMNESTTTEHIATKLVTEFPDYFQQLEDAVTRVGEVAQWYST